MCVYPNHRAAPEVIFFFFFLLTRKSTKGTSQTEPLPGTWLWQHKELVPAFKERELQLGSLN